jgi:hypothetical protein
MSFTTFQEQSKGLEKEENEKNITNWRCPTMMTRTNWKVSNKKKRWNLHADSTFNIIYSLLIDWSNGYRYSTVNIGVTQSTSEIQIIISDAIPQFAFNF